MIRQYNPIFNIIKSTIFSFIYTSSLGGNIVVHTPSQGTNGANTVSIITTKTKHADSGGKKNTFSIRFFSHSLRLFHLSTEKVVAKSVRNRHQSVYSRTDTININISKRSNVFPSEENNKIIISSGYIKWYNDSCFMLKIQILSSIWKILDQY